MLMPAAASQIGMKTCAATTMVFVSAPPSHRPTSTQRPSRTKPAAMIIAVRTLSPFAADEFGESAHVVLDPLAGILVRERARRVEELVRSAHVQGLAEPRPPSQGFQHR